MVARLCRLVMTIVFGALVAVAAGVAPWSVARAASTEQRIALVVGIGAYVHAPELPNPRNDAKAMSAALRKLGFTVEEKFDLDNRGMAEALRGFGIRAAQADVALLYFAGHGMQVGGTNFLIPADARLERERDLVYEALPLNLPMGELAQARKLGILILDACRNNPFADRLVRSGTKKTEVHSGFARVDDTPTDTLVAMATRADAVAEDGSGDHSPYTLSLLKNFDVPGLELSLFFRRVRDDVMQLTQGRQEPFLYGSLGAAPFYFNPLPENRPPRLADVKTLEVFDRGGAEPVGIGRPTDPDNDQLFAQVTGLPRGGSVRIGDRVVLIGDYLTVDQLVATTFKPDATHLGDGGSFDFAVMDGRGGVARGGVPVLIKPSNRPPVAAAERTIRTVVNALRLELPTDPDGDPLSFIVNSVPERGKVRDGTTVLKAGDRLTAEQLTALNFDPERSSVGRAGVFSVLVEDGRGGRTMLSSVLEVEEAGASPPAADLEEALWRRVRDSRDPAEVEAFLRLFDNGPFTAPARERLNVLKVEAARVASAGSSGSGATGSGSSGGAKTAAKPSPAPKTPAPAELRVEPTGEGMYVAVSDSVLRAGPDTRSDAVGGVAKGGYVRVLGRVTDADWYRVTLDDGAQGFIPGPALRPAGPDDRQRLAMAAPPGSPSDNSQAGGGQPGTGPSQRRAQGNGNSFQDCPQCPPMTRIPAGSFTMGNDKGDPTQRPAHRVAFARPFAIGVYEVTVAEWRACMEGGGCAAMPRMANVSDDTPIHNVHVEDAEAYVAWLSRKTGQRYRLPSEAEWEYAARGGASTRFSWGESLTQGVQQANCRDCGGSFDRMRPASVGSFQPNGFGLYDTSGGVAEWVADCWNPGYKGAPADGSAWTTGDCRKRVLRGGSWRDELDAIAVTTRIGYDADVRYVADGFRVARDMN
ncbi:SUMF1/EgtB/PvdO family nonheme iron enzyme [Azospirillum rugosum]|uniref:Formylglycine-generating enzyme required for sulfatase activity n=1 Tax=Azospirillum rugosum TaxID=416170 RepID=A0ABS4SQG1_9PROT|nr:SUMF1/EgtB/PvdO family nonheme iron enzyme [Azospirillum rugosum]MBP2294812.1 formylglycine-generating enzyme required for sulfatase activity [Azospirillum rugosum]MDQ0528266.1 formylglycine-generating enzyme required for sulfatase activity [Azospirillum rugosum]